MSANATIESSSAPTTSAPRAPRKRKAQTSPAPTPPAKAKKQRFAFLAEEWQFVANVGEDSAADGWTKARIAAFANLCLLSTMSNFGPWLVSYVRSIDVAFNSPLRNESLPRAIDAFTKANASFDYAKITAFAEAKKATLREAYAKRVQSIADANDREAKIREHEADMQRKALRLGKLNADTFAKIANAISDLRRSGAIECSAKHSQSGETITIALIDALSPIFGAITISQFGKLLTRFAKA